MPKISLNEWYAGKHWTNRRNFKNAYIVFVKSQFKGVFLKDKQYSISYFFEFKSNPLDCSNCVAMVKLVEDIIFESDSPRTIKSITIESKKGESDKLIIQITEL